jgi:acyl-CoA reductase-like NAD-dependent aldehyde dehydrogenase
MSASTGGFTDLVLPRLELSSGGRSLPASAYLPDIDPCTGHPFADVPVAADAQVDDIVRAALRTLQDPNWRSLIPLQRERLLHRLADAMEADLERLAALESLDTGKPIAQTRSVDVPAAISWLRTYAGWPSKLAGRAAALTASPSSTHVYTRREPVGVVAAITPWNFPLVLAMWKIAPALACGCPVVLKPAAETPLSALRLAELALQAGLPAGALQVVTGDAGTGAALVRHPGIAKVAFTGSTATGRKILADTIPAIKRVTLELGGKSPSIICADADLDRACVDAAMSCFFNAGQVCYAGTRLYAHRSIYERVLSKIAEIGAGLRMGMSSDPASELGPLISARQLDRVKGFVDRAISAGAEAVTGGAASPSSGYFFAPVVLRDVGPRAEIAREEVFGPVLAAAPFDDLDEAIALANDSPYGLAAHIWTRDLSTAHRAAALLEAGTVFVNCALLADPAFPFGGMKQSGVGRENGAEALDAYLEPKTVVMAMDS